jgi:protein-L-isoaspartate(D-aspartate) O-methyltransferase
MASLVKIHHNQRMNHSTPRQQMIEQQVRAWEVLDPKVLAVLGEIRREEFVPPEYRGVAFADTEIPIGRGESMIAPNLQGRILQAVEIQPTDRVLEVGAGTGFLTACLAKLAAQVQSLEIYPDLAATARANLRAAHIGAVTIIERDVFAAEPLGEHDVIVLTGSLPTYDPRFELALRPAGRLFAIVGVAPVMEVMLVRRMSSAQWVRESLFETCLQPLVNAPLPPKFVF